MLVFRRCGPTALSRVFGGISHCFLYALSSPYHLINHVPCGAIHGDVRQRLGKDGYC